MTDRFWSKVDRQAPSECWPWIAASDNFGYGVFSRGRGSSPKAHRIAWELTHGSIPKGLCVLHACDNPSCVNPAHLWLGTKKDNSQDMLRKGRMKSPFVKETKA